MDDRGASHRAGGDEGRDGLGLDRRERLINRSGRLDGRGWGQGTVAVLRAGVSRRGGRRHHRNPRDQRRDPVTSFQGEVQRTVDVALPGILAHDVAPSTKVSLWSGSGRGDGTTAGRRSWGKPT